MGCQAARGIIRETVDEFFSTIENLFRAYRAPSINGGANTGSVWEK